MERRAHSRSESTLSARMATASERMAPSVDVINDSDGGVLVAFHEPVGLTSDERVVISLSSPPGPMVHLLGRVARVAHGTDFRTYVAVRFDPDQEDEIAGLRRCGRA